MNLLKNTDLKIDFDYFTQKYEIKYAVVIPNAKVVLNILFNPRSIYLLLKCVKNGKEFKKNKNKKTTTTTTTTTKQAVAEFVPSSHLVQIQLTFSKMKILPS